MLRLARFLKPYALIIGLAIILLFAQALADLSLPDYISRIVNNGIQQSGIENAVPVAVRQSTMNRLTLFMADADKSDVLADYTLVDQNSPDYSRDVQTYPTLAKEPIYVLNTVDAAEMARLNGIMGRAFLAVTGVEQAASDPTKAAALGGSNFDLPKLPAGTDIFAALSQLPAAGRTQMFATLNRQFDAMGNSLVVQSATTSVKAEYVALGIDTGAMQTRYILHTGGLMLLVALLSAACTVTVGLLAARAAAGAARDIRKALFTKVESFSNAEFDKFSVSSLITRTTNDVTQLQTLTVLMLRMAFYAPILGVGGIIKATSTDSSMWWILAVAVIALIGMILAIFSTSLPKFRVIQKLVDRLNLVTRENLSGMMVVRAFNTQDFEEARFDRANTDLTDTNLFVNRVMAALLPLMTLIMNGVTVMIIWFGAQQVAQAHLRVGDLIAFMQYSVQVVMGFMFLSFMFIILPRASVSADRIADVLETESSIRDPKDPKRFSAPFHSTVEFRNVSFRYPGAEADVLHNINFTARPGEITAFIGSTGSGKSTIVNLIPRFYDVTEGAILVDGVDTRDVTQYDLRDKIGFVPQKSMLFSGTIESNLHYADENAAPEVIHEAMDIAQATQFINEKPDGVATDIAQGGANVSGGQRQRLSIARALVKRAPIYIFDDSFSALDFKTDAALRRALKEKTRSSTVMIVSQRVSTIRNAEQIIVLDEGRIAGKGTHEELLDTCEIYREIASSQLGVGELA